MRPLYRLDLRREVPARDRERPLVTGANGTLMARSFPGWSSSWCSSSPGIGANAPPLPWGFILSPSATLRVAGLDLSWPMARG